MARRPIAGLRVIVTGASSGIGRALALELAARGARVVGLARRKERLKELASVASGEVRWHAGDVIHKEDREAAIQLARREFGGLDALINNAGIGALGRFDEADEARLRQVMEVNFFAPALFLREALPALQEGRRPIVVNVGSVLGHRAVPEKSEYCASKFALHGLSDALRLELAERGIDLLLVSPSTTASEFFQAASGQARRPPGGRFGAMPPEKVARRIVQAMAAGRREIILPLTGRLLVWLDRVCPALADWALARWA